jgi:hypothetical protein
MPDLGSIVHRRPLASIARDGDSYSLGYPPARPANERPEILERGDPVPEIACHDMRLVADALADQSRRLTSRARSKRYSGPTLAIARASLRERAERLVDLAAELGGYHGLLLVRCADREAGQ